VGTGVIRGRVLNAAAAEGRVVVLEEPLSFWGGFDPASGRIIDGHHPQCGLALTGCVVLMRESRGSGTAPGAMAEAIRLGTAPAAMVLVIPDVNLAIGAAVAATLYEKSCAIVAVTSAEWHAIAAWSHAGINESGMISAGS
jgi:predicted aconitase with swiveling domain